MRLGKIKKLEEADYVSLPIFLYNSITQPEDEMYETDIINTVEYHKYIEDFGKESDLALAKERDGRISGIVWSRLFTKEDNSFGFVDEKTPELTLSVLAGYDELKIGKELVDLICNELRLLGYNQISTSLDNNNPLIDMYKQIGFEEYKEDDKNNRKTYLLKL